MKENLVVIKLSIVLNGSRFKVNAPVGSKLFKSEIVNGTMYLYFLSNYPNNEDQERVFLVVATSAPFNGTPGAKYEYVASLPNMALGRLNHIFEEINT